MHPWDKVIKHGAQREAAKGWGSHSAQRNPDMRICSPVPLTPGSDCERERAGGMPGGHVGLLVSPRGGQGRVTPCWLQFYSRPLPLSSLLCSVGILPTIREVKLAWRLEEGVEKSDPVLTTTPKPLPLLLPLPALPLLQPTCVCIYMHAHMPLISTTQCFKSYPYY